MGQLGIDPAQGPDLVEVVKAQQERAKTLVEMAENSVYFYQDFDQFDANNAKKHLRPVVLEAFQAIRRAFESLEDWSAEAIHQVINDTAEKLDMKMGKIGQPLRVAVTGSGMSPSIDITVQLIGKPRTLARLDKAIDYIEKRAANA
jgi:glutamyl-tRNA synthetase